MFMLRMLMTAVLLVVTRFALALPVIGLHEAFERTLDGHPELETLEYKRSALSAEAGRAALGPARELRLGLENVLGSGAASEFEAAEITLSLASVLERGDKRAARVALGNHRLDALELQREARRLDLLAETARRYLDAVAALESVAVAREELRQRTHTLAVVRGGVAAGGAAESVALAAEGERLRATLSLQRQERVANVARRRLGALWGEVDGRFAVEHIDLARLPRVSEYSTLAALLERAPQLRAFAGESRVREARLQLARSEARTDIAWSAGVRRLEAGSDWALVGELSMPIGTPARAAPAIRAAQAELDALEYERESVARTLEATLLEAWERLDAAVAESRAMERELLPVLRRAERAAEQAYVRGATGFVEWSQLQSASISARQELVAVRSDAHRALIELQRLSGESFLPRDAAPEESLP